MTRYLACCLALSLPLAACDPVEVDCGMLIRDDERGACVCPPGVEVDLERWLCLLPDAEVPIDPFDAGPADGGLPMMLDAMPDTGLDGGVDAPTCVPTTEQCEGLVDEDCDGEIDEGCSCVDGTDRSCGEETGACVAGRETCVGGSYGECLDAVGPAVEVCDGTSDDDCDGNVDEGCGCTDGTTQPCPSGSDVGACVAGTQRCTLGAWGACEGSVSPATEACDGTVDEDCDGNVDEGCGCTNGMSRACGTDEGLCVAGTQRCTSGRWGACTGNVGPVTETCDGSADQDCDGRVDEGCACTNGTTEPCPGGTNVGTCVAGTRTCTNGNWGTCVGQVGPRAEVCDGRFDENCDGRLDDGCECTNGTTRACPGGTNTGACEAGTQRCSSGRWGACMGAVGPTAETCNGADDDCDGVIDGVVASATCGTATNATALACSAGACVVVGCVPGTDDCNRDVSDGCEADLQSARSTCGSCMRTCSATQVCAAASCTDAPLLEDSVAGIARAQTYFVDEVSTGDWWRTSLQLGAESDGSAVLVESYDSVGGVGSTVQSLDPDLTPAWRIYRDARMRGPACSGTACMVTTLNDQADDYLARYALTSASPTRIEIAVHREVVAPPVLTPGGQWAHVSSAFEETFGSSDLRVVGATDGRIAAMGRTNVVYTTMNARQLRATRLDGTARWTFTMPTGWTVRDAVAGPAASGGGEAYVYVLSTRSFGSRFESRLSLLDASDGSESDWYDLTSATRSLQGASIALGADGNVYMVGRTATKSLLVAFGPDVTLLYQREAGGTAYSRFDDVVSLPSGELLVLGLLTSGTFTFGGNTFGSGSAPASLVDSPEGEHFVLRLRVQ